MEDVLDPTDINIYRDLAGGTTTSNILHGSANAIGGKTVVIKLRRGKTRASDLVFQGALPGIKFALGENVTPQARPGRDQPAAIPRRRGRAWNTSSATRSRAPRPTARTGRNTTRRRSAGQDVLAPRRDLQLDALVEVLEGKRLVHAHSYRADEILMLIRLADEMGFKITTFQHVLEGYKVAKEIAAHNAGASTFSDWWGYKIEADDAIPYNASLMTHKGVLRLDQLRRRRAGAPAEHGGGEGDALRRRHRGSGLRDGDDQPGEAAQDRQPRRLDRSRQGRRPGGLEPPSAVAPPRSSSAPTSTASPTTTARRTCSAIADIQKEKARPAVDDRRRLRSPPTARRRARRRRGARRRPRSSTSRATRPGRPGRSPTPAS